jgi:Starch-binding associating with outer membrane
MKRTFIGLILLSGLLAGLAGCQKGDLIDNPNVASTNSLVPTSLIMNRLTNELYYGGGVIDAVGTSSNSSSGPAQNEGPWSEVHRWNQFYLSLYSYYWGSNFYTWSNSATMYSVLKYVNLMQGQVPGQFGTQPNAYSALAYFFKAYQFVWYTQRVGDIPMAQAGVSSILTPAYNTQHDVYKGCLALLDTANTLLQGVIAIQGSTATVSGDIYGLTLAQWQKVVNTYKLRVLISLSKRAVDNPDLNIPTQFANIINNPSQYPIMAGITDNLEYKYNAIYNKYPTSPNYTPYDFYEAMSSTFLNITTATQDPRTFIAATPAPAQITGTGAKALSDFTAYVGADITQAQAGLLTASENGAYSYANYLRYFADATGATEEPAIIIGYPEMCFNIAEAAYLGWIPNSMASTWYLNGIKGSLAMYGLQDGTVIPIGDDKGHSLGTVTANVTTFLNNVQYNSATGLTQILTQKYIAFWQNSGWEAYYNWRRTGIPAFGQGGSGSGIGTPSKMIPLRWQYPTDESVENTANWQNAITGQYGGSDDITQPMWLIK